jgi:hypothetical protein
LGEEAQRVSARAAEAAGAQDQMATNDTVATIVGVIVFWPALFMVKGNDTVTGRDGSNRAGFDPKALRYPIPEASCSNAAIGSDQFRRQRTRGICRFLTRKRFARALISVLIVELTGQMPPVCQVTRCLAWLISQTVRGAEHFAVGRTILWRCLRLAGIHRTSITPGGVAIGGL